MPKYAEAYCRISSYLQTMADQGYNPLVAIQLALSGEIYADRGESLHHSLTAAAAIAHNQ